MSAKKPVVLYGASGFSRRLVTEFLREYHVPFIAAGRNRKKIEDVMNRVPGIETADYEVAETGDSAAELANVFSGAKVVCNTVGPFLYHGPRVVEACLQAGCHYVDISGEQAWIRDVAENWGPKFAQRGLLVAPATAYMSATSDIRSRRGTTPRAPRCSRRSWRARTTSRTPAIWNSTLPCRRRRG